MHIVIAPAAIVIAPAAIVIAPAAVLIVAAGHALPAMHIVRCPPRISPPPIVCINAVGTQHAASLRH
jgi:hypothetical protein